MKKLILALALVILATLPGWSSALTFTVTNCANDGTGSLRWAITSAEAAGGNCNIVFDITTAEAGYSTDWNTPGLVNYMSDPTFFRIVVGTSELPAITQNNIAILGSTQTREANNTLGPKVEIVCYGYWLPPYAAMPFNGLTLKGNNCTVEGLAINHFISPEAAAIIMDSGASNNIVKSCYLGIYPLGNFAISNHYGVRIRNGTYNVIGGASSGDRNLIAGNNGHGIYLDGASVSSNEVRNNYIGLHRDGTSAVANGRCGVYLTNAVSNIIAGNVISGQNNNSQSGIGLYLSDYNRIFGNKLGTNAGGTGSLPNYYGISFEGGSDYNTVGGSTEAERNIISGNTFDGIKLSGEWNAIKGNYIGLTSAGGSLGNGNCGIYAEYSRYSVIGGDSAEEANYIGSNTIYGIYFSGSSATSNEVKGNYIGRSPGGGNVGNIYGGIAIDGGGIAADMHNKIGPKNYIAYNGQVPSQRYGISIRKSNYNLITQNSMEANTGKGIYLDDANSGITSPEVWGAVRDPVSGIVTIEGRYDAEMMVTSVIEVFKTEPDPGEVRGEGLVYLGTVYGNGGFWTLVYTGEALSVGDKVCATHTKLAGTGYTSEFSRNRSVYPTNTVFRWEDQGPGTLRDVISHAQAGAEISFNMTTTESDSTSGFISGGGNSWFKIDISSPLTIETNSLYIHGSTQTREVSNALGPKISVSPYNTSWSMDGFDIRGADNCTLEGMAIAQFQQANRAAIYLNSGASYNTIKNCYIGCDTTGAMAGNDYYGIYLDFSDHTLIGGPSASDRNLIAGCASNGIYIGPNSGTNEVRGNYIGMARNGWDTLGNLDDGIRIHDSSHNLIIGNLISGQTGHADDAGILIENYGSTDNQIKGNLIGTDASGGNAKPNRYGIYLMGTSGSHQIGGADPADRNIISGNTYRGIFARYSGTSEVRNNYIGLNQAGTTALANGDIGIHLEDSPDMVIRDNVISGHSGSNDSGISLGRQNEWSQRSDRARIFGNKIGTNASGTAAIPNYFGILSVYTYRCVIGGTTEAERNLISGNSDSGIYLSQSSTNEIKGNYIGLSAAGNVLGNSNSGIYLSSAPGNLIGGDSVNDRNYIGGNGNGITFQWDSTSNEVKGNYIGRSPAGGNVGNQVGVFTTYGTMWPLPPPNNLYSTIGPYNYFSYNQNAIAVNNNNYVVITRNTMEADVTKGISIYPGMNNNIQPPGISSAYYRGSTNRTTLTGTAAASSVVELFTASYVPGGMPFPPANWEGKSFLGSVEANGSGNWIATVEGLATGDKVTANATKYGSPGYSSEFAWMGEVAIQPPSVEVTSPIGGEKWKGGTNYNITFTCTDEAGIAPSSAALYYNDGGGWTPINTGQATDSAYSWNPIPSVSSNTVKVKVTVMDIDGNQGTAESAAFFTIDSTPPTVTVNIPNGGEKWKGGMSNNITWTANDNFGMPANPISIEASFNSGVAYGRIATDEANDGTFSWTTQALNTNEAKVKVLAVDEVGNVGSDESNSNFIIDITLPSTGTLESPANNTTTNDATTTFVWQAATDNLSGVASYEITIDTRVVTLGAVTTYTTPDALTDGPHTWKVRAKDGAGWWGDFSPTWLVTVEAVTPECSAIVLKDRTSGSTVITDELTVTIEAQGIQGNPAQLRIAQDIAFTQNDTGWIAYQNPTTYTFSAGYGTREAYYRLKNAFGTESAAHSDSIIVDTPSPTVQVINPSSGESLTALTHIEVRGENIYIDEPVVYVLRWEAGSGAGLPDDPITLYYSLDNGQTWITIEADVPNTGAYNWEVPKFNSSTCLISVEVETYSGGHFYAQSSGSFNIESVIPAVVSISPAHGSTGVPATTEVVAVFSDPMSPEATQVAFSLSSSEGTFRWSGDKKTMTYTPASALSYLTTYQVNIRSSAVSLAKNPLPYPYASSFKTADQGDREAPHCLLQIVDRDRRSNTLKSGDYISRQPWFKGVITDDLGVDQSSVKLYLDDALVSPVVSVISPTRIEVNYQLTSDLEDETVRTHSLKLEAKDTSGNTGEKLIQNLKVSYGAARIIGPVLAYPQLFKPKSGEAAVLAYNLSADSDVMIYTFSTAGENPWTARCLSGAAGGRAGYNEVSFSGRSQLSGSLLGNGNYVFKITANNRVIGTGYITIFD